MQEDVDLVGLCILSGAHVGLTTRAVAALRAARLDHVALVVGGTIPEADRKTLLELGAAAVYPTGTRIEDVVAGINALVPVDGA